MTLTVSKDAITGAENNVSANSSVTLTIKPLMANVSTQEQQYSTQSGVGGTANAFGSPENGGSAYTVDISDEDVTFKHSLEPAMFKVVTPTTGVVSIQSVTYEDSKHAKVYFTASESFSGAVKATALPAAFNEDVDDVNTTDTTLESLEVKTPPTKTAYTTGQKFDPTGMVITAHLSDGRTMDIDDVTLYGLRPGVDDALATSDTAVTASYRVLETKTTTVAITVEDVTYTVSGAVTKGNNVAESVSVDGLAVNLYAKTDTEFTLSMGEALTADGGKYAIEGVKVGEYTAVVEPSEGNYERATADFTISDANVENVNLELTAKSADATLKSLSYSVDNAEAVSLTAEQLTATATSDGATIELASDVSATAKVTLTGECNDDSASITKNEGVTLANGAGTATLEVTAEDGEPG